MALTADFERGTNGSTIALADAGSASVWDAVSSGTNATRTYSNAFAAHGALSGKFSTGATASQASYASWSTQFGTQTDHYGRAAILLPAFPASTATTIIAFINSGLTCAGIKVTSGGLVQLVNKSGTTTNMTGSALTTSHWWRLEWHITHSTTTGSITVNVYDGDSTTVRNTVSQTNVNTDTQATSCRFGLPATEAAANYSHYVDDIVAAAAAFPGPVVARMPRPLIVSSAVMDAAVR